jgi:putative mRNA 3-end processing factor
MTKPQSLLCPRPEGLYCPPGDFYVDPTRPVDRAIITHGHSDHARAGHGVVAATAETLAIMGSRYGQDFAGSVQALAYGEILQRHGVDIQLVPAGHILGSAQVVLRWKGLTIVVSGDYKRRPDPTCPPFEPTPCDVFVTEATFGLPVFDFPPDGDEIAKLLKSLEQFPQRTHMVGAYALGKAQRIVRVLRQAGYDRTLYMHGAMERLNALYGGYGVDLGPTAPATGGDKKSFEGALVIAPPSALEGPWLRRFADPLPAFASGWMRVKARARQRHVELPLIISDHADWTELTGTVAELNPGEVWVTHGSEDALLRWCALQDIEAKALDIVGYEAEDDD